jgi:fluoride ion exporter CrcB/FEX
LAGIFKNLSIFVHALSSGIGLGVVLVVDYLFMKFLKDKKISNHEKEVLDHLSDFIWLILGLIIVSGFYIYMSDMAKYHISTKFQFKMIVIGVIVLNGFLMNLMISPKLLDLDMVNISSYKEKMAISMGSISAISWFSAFLLGRLKNIDFPLIYLVLIYFFVLIVISLISIKLFKLKYK